MNPSQKWPEGGLSSAMVRRSRAHNTTLAAQKSHCQRPKTKPSTPGTCKEPTKYLSFKGGSELVAETDFKKTQQKFAKIPPHPLTFIHPSLPQNPQRGSVTAALGGGPSRSREAASAKRWKALAARCKDGEGGAGPQWWDVKIGKFGGFHETTPQEIRVSL